MSAEGMSVRDASAVDVSGGTVRWTPTMRVIFRIVAIYLVLYGLTCFFTDFSYFYYFLAHKVSYPVETAMRGVVPWVGKHVLGVHAPISTKVAADSPFMWIEDFCFLLFSLVGASVWTLLDRGRPNYRTLDQWLRLWVRVTLAVSMFIERRCGPRMERTPGAGTRAGRANEYDRNGQRGDCPCNGA